MLIKQEGILKIIWLTFSFLQRFLFYTFVSSDLFGFSFVNLSLDCSPSKVRLFAFPSFSQWYKEKGDWREEIAGAREVERACVCLCIVIYPACKEGVVSVNEVNFSVCNSQASLRLWTKGPHLPSLYCEPLELIQLFTCLTWNWMNHFHLSRNLHH